MMRPPACQALARFPFDQQLSSGGWALLRTLSSRSGQSPAPCKFLPRDWSLFCSQGFLGAGSSVHQCGRASHSLMHTFWPGFNFLFFP